MNYHQKSLNWKRLLPEVNRQSTTERFLRDEKNINLASFVFFFLALIANLKLGTQKLLFLLPLLKQIEGILMFHTQSPAWHRKLCTVQSWTLRLCLLLAKKKSAREKSLAMVIKQIKANRKIATSKDLKIKLHLRFSVSNYKSTSTKREANKIRIWELFIKYVKLKTFKAILWWNFKHFMLSLITNEIIKLTTTFIRT